MVLIDMEMPKRCIDCPFMASREGDNCVLQSDEKNASFENWDDMKDGCPLKPFTPPEPKITTNIYNQEEIHHGCTVQILRNSVTGDVSVGWWEEKEDEE